MMTNLNGKVQPLVTETSVTDSHHKNGNLPCFIEVTNTGILIRNIEIPHKDVAEYFKGIPAQERDRTLMNAIELGISCLQRTQTSQETDFVKRQFESLIAEIEKKIAVIPETLEEALLSKIGTDDGQVLDSIPKLMNGVSGTLTERLNGVKELLSQELDPDKKSSTLGKILGELKNLLDPNLNNSIQGSLKVTLEKVASQDSALVKTVKTVVSEAVKPLADEVDRLSKEIRGQSAATAALQQTTEKGFLYEDEVLLKLRPWSQQTGAEVIHVGSDNQAGDILIKLSPLSLVGTPITMVIEARDRQDPWGHRAIKDSMTRAMSQRQATLAIYLSRSRNGLSSKEIGEWAEGTCECGSYVATTDEHLITAVRYLISLQRIAIQRASMPEIDAGAVESQVKRIRTAIGSIANINREVTAIRKSADTIRSGAETLRDEVRDSLRFIEDTVGRV